MHGPVAYQRNQTVQNNIPLYRHTPLEGDNPLRVGYTSHYHGKYICANRRLRLENMATISGIHMGDVRVDGTYKEDPNLVI